MSVTLLPDKQRLLLSIKNMATLKLLEEQSKLASMGEMIGNIAHQWRQPLSIISTSATGLAVKSEFGESITSDDIENFSESIVKVLFKHIQIINRV
jgi:signal transduction histidine kinase